MPPKPSRPSQPRPTGAASASKRARPSTSGDAAAPAAADGTTAGSLLYLSADHTAQLRQAFNMFDTAGTGRIKVGEVKVALHALGYAVNNTELESLLRACGVPSASGSSWEEAVMDFHEFCNVLLRKMTAKENRVESIRAFKQIDEDNKGYISHEDLREIADSLDMRLTDEEITEMILFARSAGGTGRRVSGDVAQVSEFGVNESNVVSEEQFLKLLKRADAF